MESLNGNKGKRVGLQLVLSKRVKTLKDNVS